MICLERIPSGAVPNESEPSPRLSGLIPASETEKAQVQDAWAKGENEEECSAVPEGPTFDRPELLPYYSESWFTAEGSRLKERRLRRRGVPNLKNWRFVTLTVADRSITPREAYEKGKGRLRRFLAHFREAVGHFRWLWKLEFHHDEDGYAHWHLLIEYKQRIPTEFFPTIEKWWNLGRINIKRVKGEDIRYVFKYVAKGLEDLPDWVRCFKGRMRVFQTSPGFFDEKTQRKAREKNPPRLCMVPVSLVTRFAWDARKAIACVVDQKGRRQTRVVRLRYTFAYLQVMQANAAIRVGRVLASPGAVSLSLHQLRIIQNDSRTYTGFGRVPQSAAFCFEYPAAV